MLYTSYPQNEKHKQNKKLLTWARPAVSPKPPSRRPNTPRRQRPEAAEEWLMHSCLSGSSLLRLLRLYSHSHRHSHHSNTPSRLRPRVRIRGPDGRAAGVPGDCSTVLVLRLLLLLLRHYYSWTTPGQLPAMLSRNEDYCAVQGTSRLHGSTVRSRCCCCNSSLPLCFRSLSLKSQLLLSWGMNVFGLDGLIGCLFL
jgi:hypothetical protein